jgi:hypothetical protein
MYMDKAIVSLIGFLLSLFFIGMIILFMPESTFEFILLVAGGSYAGHSGYKSIEYFGKHRGWW